MHRFEITYSLAKCPFGWCVLGMNGSRICGLSFLESDDKKKAAAMIRKFSIPFGETVNYSDIARTIKSPRAVRAVGTACGRNPINFIIPCHRVLTSDGGLGGYNSGIKRKKEIVEWEAELRTKGK